MTTYYNLHSLLDEISDYLCKINFPKNRILEDRPYELYEVLNDISKYICEIHVENNCVLSPSPATINQFFDNLADYLCKIDLKNDCLDVEMPASLHEIIDGITDYLCNISIEYTCTGIGSSADLYSILNNLNTYLCKIQLDNNCLTDNVTDLYDILQNIIDYVCEIELEYNCIAAPNPGNLHEILNAVADYVCRIPVCDNCIIFNDDENLHNAINLILDYICDIYIQPNCMDISERSTLYDVLQKISTYICEIPTPINCLGMSDKENLHDVLSIIINYICHIPPNYDSLYSALQLIIQSYCGLNHIPIFHIAIDIDYIQSLSTVEIVGSSGLYSFDDLLNTIQSVYGFKIPDNEKNNMGGKIIVELKSFVVPSWGAEKYTMDDKYHLGTDLYTEPVPANSLLNEINYKFWADIGDYGFCRYKAMPEETNILDSNNSSIAIELGPEGSLISNSSDDLSQSQQALFQSGSQYEQSGCVASPVRNYSQRARCSYRIHLIVASKTSLNMDSCDLISYNISPHASGSATFTQPPPPTTTTTVAPIDCIAKEDSNMTNVYYVRDISGSTGHGGFTLNGNAVKISDGIQQILDDHNAGDYDTTPDSSVSSVEKDIRDVIEDHGGEVSGTHMTVIHINDSKDGDGGLDSDQYWDKIVAAMANYPFKLNVYLLRALPDWGIGNSDYASTGQLFEDYKNAKPSCVDVCEVVSFTSYTTGGTDEVNDLMGQALGGYQCECSDGSTVYVTSAQAGTVTNAQSVAQNSCP